MTNPFELVFTNILFFYPAFRPEDAVSEPSNLLRDALRDADASGSSGKRDLMIYLHIPFCRHICRFCGYHRMRLSDPEILSSYVDRLLSEMKQWSAPAGGPHRKVSHLYFGGGTPTLLPDRELSRLVEGLHKAFAVSDATQFDMESDLASLQDSGNLKRYRAAGVKRISVGVQSFDPAVRKMAGMEPDGFDKAFGCLREAGYAIHYDLMFGLPGQSVESFLKDIQKSALETAADHVDLLEFFPQPEAYFTRRFDRYADLIAGRDTRRAMYARARAFLLKNGYAQHSLTDFWRKAIPPNPFKAMLYRNADIIGLGAGAHGIMADCAYCNARLHDGYLKEPWNRPPLAFVRRLSPSLLRTRSLALLPKLLSFSEADIAGGITPKERSLLQSFVRLGLMKKRKGVYTVTENGLLNSADMMLEVLRQEEARGGKEDDGKAAKRLSR